MDTYPYFIIKFIENKEEKQLITETYSLVPSLLEIEKRGAEIIEIEDNTEETYTKEEILNLEKVKIEKLYDGKNTLLEIYDLAYHHFRELFDKNVLTQEVYEQYIDTLNKIRQKTKQVEEFKKMVIELFIS